VSEVTTDPEPLITVLHFVPNEGLFLKQVPRDDLCAQQQLVGGLIEITVLVQTSTFSLDLVCNEEGMNENLPSGWVWPLGSGQAGVPIFGSFFVCRSVHDTKRGYVFASVERPDVKYVTTVFATRIGSI
jgi:hypothetical protein